MDELAAALVWSRRRVELRLANTRRTRQELPRVWDAWRAGHVDAYRVDVIVDAARRLVDTGHVRRLDEEAASVLDARTAGQLRAWCSRFVARAEPAELEHRHTLAFADRLARTTQDDDGMGSLLVTTSSVDLHALDARLTALARGLGGDDPRGMDQRRSDLAVDLLLGRAGTGSQRAGAAPSATTCVEAKGASAAVVVVVSWTALLGADDAPGHLADGTPIPASVVRAVAERPGTVFHRLLTDPRGRILDLTQLGRFPDPPLRLATTIRDGTCMFPTCTATAERCDCDHTVPSPDGPTCWCNLACLCRRHHRLKQQPGVALEQPSPGVLRWTLPSGRTYLVAGEPLGAAGSPQPAEPTPAPEPPRRRPSLPEARLRELLDLAA